uniref:t-SNARE coiled-coil homology domain-containing protein n=1 Tax=Syphacia muris TaxID=451379 RepID=A0A158R6C2_9BILA
MVRDRSSEFRRQVAKNETNLDILENGSVTDTPSDSFFNSVFEIRKVMEELNNDIVSLKSRQADILARATVEESHKNELEHHITQIKKEISKLKLKLVQMKTTLEHGRNGEGPRNATDMRIRKHQVESLIKKLSDLIEQFTAAQNGYRERVAKRLKRQLELAGEEATNEEIDAMLESNSTQIFYRGVTTAAGRLALEDASSRNREILRLEQSIAELNEMYNDIAFLVHSQGETVSKIEDNVGITLENVEAGGSCARQAVRYKQRAIRKKICCTIISIAILLIIIAVIVVLCVTLT